MKIIISVSVNPTLMNIVAIVVNVCQGIYKLDKRVFVIHHKDIVHILVHALSAHHLHHMFL